MKTKASANIIRFRYENLRNETHVELHTTFNALVTRFNPETLGIARLYDEYKPLFDDEKTMLDFIRKSRLTAGIGARDRVRNSLHRGFADNIKSHRRHFDADKREAARKLDMIVKHYGDIPHKGLDEKTAAMADLYDELRKPEHFEWITLLGLAEWLEQLALANDAVAEIMRARYAELSQRPAIHMRSVRREIDWLFRQILDRLESLILVGEEDVDSAFLASLNAMMERYKDILAQETGRRQKKKDLAAGGHIVIEVAAIHQYTGKAITPIPKVYYREEGKPEAELFFARDFSVSYRNNINTGMADLIVYGIGGYKGQKKVTFNIVE